MSFFAKFLNPLSKPTPTPAPYLGGPVPYVGGPVAYLGWLQGLPSWSARDLPSWSPRDRLKQFYGSPWLDVVKLAWLYILVYYDYIYRYYNSIMAILC